MVVYAVEDKKDSFWPLIICGVNVGLIDEGLLGRYDIKTKQHIINLEGHVKRILRQNFDISIESAEDVKEIELKLRKEKNQTIAEWFNEFMKGELKQWQELKEIRQSYCQSMTHKK